ncbi:MAG: family 43 glycosylhydrolase [Bifidobacterium sp.]|jgi:GH43 family beta-xylosidase|nr:family 43 glycosylhydrolase [Bifidobacterium sp.]MCI1864730.1 family 43 glycosylhydrolase [Bifidobacterium sp.]
MPVYNNPIVLQRADPWVLKYQGEYYFTGSDPQYRTIAIRHSGTIDGLQSAEETVVWRHHESGPMSKYIWAPELHRIDGSWYIYFAAAEHEFEPSGLPTHRMYVLANDGDDPTRGSWIEKGQIRTPMDSFSLDATTEVIDGVQYLVWAQKDPAIEGNSNLYIARMKNPWTLQTRPVMLSAPEYDWECVDFKVNEGPAFLLHDDDVFLTYSASGTGVPYAMGLLRNKRGADFLDAGTWRKSAVPVFQTCARNGQYGPGHNSFTTSEDGTVDLMIYHARNYTDITGDPLFDPNRHARVGVVAWHGGSPDFSVPVPDTRWTPKDTQILPPDGGPRGGTPA